MKDPLLRDRLRVWKTKTKNKESSLIILAAYKCEGGYTVYDVEGDGFRLDDLNRKKLMKIFGKIFNPILFDDKLSDKEAGLPPALDFDAKTFHMLPQKDESLAFPCLFTLATGHCVWEGNFLKDLSRCGNALAERKARGVFVAKELLMYLGCGKPKVSRFQKFLSETIESFVGQGRMMLVETLSKYTISASTSFQKSEHHRRVIAALDSENHFGPTGKSKFNFYIMSKDNFDLTIKGAQPGNDSWVVPIRYCETEESLKKIGFYQEDQDKRISRERTLDRSDLNSNEICFPSEHEWKQLTVSVLQMLDSVMRLKLPTLEEAKTMISSEHYPWGEYSNIPRDYGVNLDCPESPRVQDGKRIIFSLSPREGAEHEDADDGEDDLDATRREREEFEQLEDLKHVKGLVSQNNLVVDLPFHENLNKKEVVQGMMYNIKSFVDDIAESDDSEDHPSGELPVQDLMIPTSGDGAPTAIELKIKNCDMLKPWREREFEKVQSFSGGFHWLKEVLERRASSLYDVVGFFVKQYRDTERKMKTVMQPHDPRQAEEEMPFYIAAFFRAAADEYASMTNQKSVSPSEVHKHMLERACEDPLVLAILQDLRFVQIFVLFQCAEKTRSADLFIAAIRLILPFLMTANAPNYISIATETVVWWELASDAEKVIFENCILTRKTAKGKPAYLDRLQEMMNTYFRFKVGDTWTPSTKSLMEKAAFDVYSQEAHKRNIDNFRNQKPRGARTAYTAKEVRRHNSIYIKLYVRIRTMNLWGKGPIIVDGFEHPSAHLYSPGSSNELDAEVLRSYAIGQSRLVEYIDKYFLDGYTVERQTNSETGVQIGFVGKSVEQEKKMKDARKTLRISIESKAVEKAAKDVGRNNGGPKTQLWNEISLVRSAWKKSIPESCLDRINQARKRDKVDEIASCLAFIRSELFSKDHNARATMEKELLEKSSAAENRRDERELIVQDPIFSLSDIEIANFQDKIKLNNV